MTFATIHKKLNKPAKDICRLIKGMNIGDRHHWSNAEIQSDLFSHEEYTEIKHYVEWKKEDYVKVIREYLENNPFSTYQDITNHISRPASYTWWIITEMSFSESDLAETDNDELFLVNEKTKEMLDKRGDLW